jgi:hypothetical protein
MRQLWELQPPVVYNYINLDTQFLSLYLKALGDQTHSISALVTIPRVGCTHFAC